jgi:hypothetical protein
MPFLIHDRGTTFTRSFDTVFLLEGIDIVLTPFRAPKANALAERWIRFLREECLDHILIVNGRHLRRVLIACVTFYNEARPHQRIEQQTPRPGELRSKDGIIQHRAVLGGCCMTTTPGCLTRSLAWTEFFNQTGLTFFRFRRMLIASAYVALARRGGEIVVVLHHRFARGLRPYAAQRRLSFAGVAAGEAKSGSHRRTGWRFDCNSVARPE